MNNKMTDDEKLRDELALALFSEAKSEAETALKKFGLACYKQGWTAARDNPPTASVEFPQDAAYIEYWRQLDEVQHPMNLSEPPDRAVNLARWAWIRAMEEMRK